MSRRRSRSSEDTLERKRRLVTGEQPRRPRYSNWLAPGLLLLVVLAVASVSLRGTGTDPVQPASKVPITLKTSSIPTTESTSPVGTSPSSVLDGPPAIEQPTVSATMEPATPVPTERTPEPVATNQRVLIAIQGMTCGGCQAGVTRGLYATPGVEEADVSFRKGQAVVVYDPAVISPEGLVDAIHAMGSKYSARVMEEDPA